MIMNSVNTLLFELLVTQNIQKLKIWIFSPYDTNYALSIRKYVLLKIFPSNMNSRVQKRGLGSTEPYQSILIKKNDSIIYSGPINDLTRNWNFTQDKQTW